MRLVTLTALLSLAACETPSGLPLISAASPAAADARNAEPQSANSLPPGAAGLQSGAPNGTHPNYLSATFKPF